MANVINAITSLDTSEAHSVTIEKYKERRSQSSNGLSHVWYQEVANARGTTAEEVKKEFKLRFGVPILRAESETFRCLYDKCIKNSLSYEEKLEAMAILPVTSLMDSEQMNKYLNSIQMTLSAQEGIILTTPQDSEYEKWSKINE